MAQLRTNDFTFNSTKLSSFGFQVVTIGSGNNTRKVGLSRTITKAEGVGGEYYIEKVGQNVETIEIVITKTDQRNNALEITQDDLDKLNNWLFSPTDYKELIATEENDGIVYYGMFIEAVQTHYAGGVGYISLKFELDSNHAYGVIETITKTVEGTTSFYIDLKDNISEEFFPDVEFNVTNGNSFSIVNETLGITMEFNNLDGATKQGRIYGENMMFMISLTDKEANMRAKSNRTFLKLKQGRNRITVNGTGTFKFIIQPKIALQ